jgi:Lytic transglycolase
MVRSGEEMAIGKKNGKLIYKDTASGDPFNPNIIRAAHRTLPLGSCVLVKVGDETLEVIINDRGPAEWTENIIDITRVGPKNSVLRMPAKRMSSYTNVNCKFDLHGV